MKSICLCGAEQGTKHSDLCPYPYYGNEIADESAWMDAWRAKRDDQNKTQPIKRQDVAKRIIQKIGG